jgi:hypothetical protein
MGLGGGPREWDDYEWFSLGDAPADSGEPLAGGLLDWFAEHPLWQPGGSHRLLLVDLDNLRAEPRRWRARMAVVLWLGRQAHAVALAGQVGAVRRARPHLAELSGQVRAVADGSDLADYVLLEAAEALTSGPAQIVVVSNDGIFAALADRGRLTVLSPGADALSERLGSAADKTVDLAYLEELVGSSDGSPASALASPEQAPAKRVPAKKAPAKRVAAKRVAAKKVAAKKVAAKKVAAKKVAAKKVAANKAVARNRSRASTQR